MTYYIGKVIMMACNGNIQWKMAKYTRENLVLGGAQQVRASTYQAWCKKPKKIVIGSWQSHGGTPMAKLVMSSSWQGLFNLTQ